MTTAIVPAVMVCELSVSVVQLPVRAVAAIGSQIVAIWQGPKSHSNFIMLVTAATDSEGKSPWHRHFAPPTAC